MAPDYTFYFAWVDSTETTFTSAHMRWDENVLSATIDHAEGQIPTMSIVVRNPQIGLLNPGRKYWAWYSVSFDNGVTAIPLFFGRIVGLPINVDPSTLIVTIEFTARPNNYIQQKQNVAETLKILPYYDPVFVTQDKRDDPDTILEGWSLLWHVDRTTGLVSASDVLIGEDGTISFSGPDAFYDSLKIHLDQSPLVAVNVQASVKWSQQWRGFFDVTSGSIQTYTGETFINEWPQSGTNLGGGYTVAVGWAANADYSIELAQTAGNYSYSYHWQNNARTHNTGDTMTVDISYTVPSYNAPGAPATYNGFGAQSGPGISHIYFKQVIPGLIVPNNRDFNGDPDPINQPASSETKWIVIPQWTASYVLNLRYDANRQRTERLQFTLQSDVQPILADALVTQDTETITLTGADVSLPIFNYENWSSVAGQAVALGTFIFPDNPTVPGQTSIQVCVSPGTAGLIEPIFFNVPGMTTLDGSVTWSSLGDTKIPERLSDWTRATPVALGTQICPKPTAGVDPTSLEMPGQLSFPPHGVGVSMFQILGIGAPGQILQEVTTPGLIGGPFVIIINGAATTHNFVNPTGKSLWICTQAGQTGLFRPYQFPDVPGTVVIDGGAHWTNAGLIDLPIGGWPGMTGRRSYFPSDRGLLSLQNLIYRARAKLRWRSRAAQVSWDCPFEFAVSLSCRMNAYIADTRLPGGQAAGKIISYRITADGNSGLFYGSVTIGCAVGNANSLVTTIGTNVYADGVFDTGVQQTIGTVNPVGDDVGYTPPVENTTDDGLTFPLNGIGDAILDSTFYGDSSAEQIIVEQVIQQIDQSVLNGQTVNVSAVGGSATASISLPNFSAVQNALFDANLVGMWYSASLRPVTNGPFDSAYVVSVTNLMIPKLIDLEAA